jgi:ribonuclease D
MFDTQVAAAFLGYGFSKGYAKLVQAALELELDKHETRSDWLQRPLTASQCRYAAEDVYFLIKIYDKLSRKLEQNGRMAWFMEDMSQLVSDARLSPDVDNYYLRIKGAWRLNGNELALLQAMATWREEEARKSNKPRGRIVHDTSLLELARQKPANRHGLSAIEGMKPQSIRRYGETLLDLIDEHTASNRALAELPAPLDREQRQLLSNYREKIEVKSESLDIAPELLARKKELELLVRSQCGGEAMLPPALAMGWRFDVIGKELLENVG